jgi:hypothetical protein
MQINVAVIEKTKYLPVALKNLKFLQNVLQRYKIIPDFFENS